MYAKKVEHAVEQMPAALMRFLQSPPATDQYGCKSEIAEWLLEKDDCAVSAMLCILSRSCGLLADELATTRSLTEDEL